VVDAAEELSAADVARALAGAPTEEQRQLAVASEELRLGLARQREERKR
jgi:hypothetical protein